MVKKAILLVLLLSLSILSGCKEKEIIINKPIENDVTYKDSNNLKILNIVSDSDIPSLDPSKSTDTTFFEAIGNTMEGLFVLVGGDILQNGVCESYSVNEDGLIYTFNLRNDSFWSNGDAVTAHDFVYSWKRLANPKTDFQYDFMIDIANIKNGKAILKDEKPVEELGVYAKDNYTLIVELEGRIPYLPSLLSFPSFIPINQKFAEEKGKFFGDSIENTLFNGPYVLNKWETESEFVYKKNNSYWNKDNINIDIINTRIVKDPKTALDMYKNNKLDMTTLIKEQIAENSNDKNLVKTLGTAVFYLSLDQESEVLKNVNVRKALALGFDKSYITDEILKNGSIPADYLVPKNFTTGPDGKHFRDSTKTYNHYNKEESANYWNKAKNELNIENANLILSIYDSETSRKISNYIKEQLESNLEGLTIEIVQISFKSSIPLQEPPKADINFSGWGPDYLDPMTFLDMWITDSDHNVIKYTSKEYDNIIENSKSGDLSTDLNKRWSELQRAEKILLEDDVVLIPLYQKGRYILLKDYIKNWKNNSVNPDYYYGFMDVIDKH